MNQDNEKLKEAKEKFTKKFGLNAYLGGEIMPSGKTENVSIDAIFDFFSTLYTEEIAKGKRERFVSRYTEDSFYTGYCDKNGVKIYSGDWVRFEKTFPKGGIWEAKVIFDDGFPTVSFVDARLIKNPDEWKEEHSWLKSRWWSIDIGYPEYGSWNSFRKPLIEIAGSFKNFEEYQKAEEKFNSKYGKHHSLDNLYRPLPIEVVANVLSQQTKGDKE